MDEEPQKWHLKHLPLPMLKMGQSVIVGPYKASTTSATVISREKIEGMEFSQRKMILVDPLTSEAFSVYLITRVDKTASKGNKQRIVYSKQEIKGDER